MYDFLFIIIELFSHVTGGNLRGWVTSIAHFRWKVTSPTNHCWVAEN